MDRIIVVDFGSQYTQLIARRIREQNVYCTIQPYHKEIVLDDTVKGIILSGSPSSVNDPSAPMIDVDSFWGKVPVLGICYGAQLISRIKGGKVENSPSREYGRAQLQLNSPDSALLHGVSDQSQVWMSHGDSIMEVPEHFELLAGTDSIATAAFGNKQVHVYCLQFHPEVTHSSEGAVIVANFLFRICKTTPDWTPGAFVENTIKELKAELKGHKVICGLSGGVDSTVAAALIHRAIGDDLTCIFVDNGLLRKGEYEQVLDKYSTLGLKVIGVNSSAQFLDALKDISDPEQKRKIIGKVFIDVFEEQAHKLQGVEYLAQGTIYPDVIESVSVKGPSATIKSHHNVGGLPDKLKLKIVEPLKYLFKDEVRKAGYELGLDHEFVGRHPFPGPGLAIRVISDITREKLALLREADDIFISELKSSGLYDEVWQAFVVLLPVSSVGVMGDERTYENVVALRSVSSVDGMTADWSRLPFEFLANVSNKIINKVKGVNRVVYDISSKPPATIEWE